MEKITKHKFSSSLIWKITEQLLSASITLMLTMILARILSPKEFGVITLAVVFVSFSEIFIQAGFNTALIKKTDSDWLDYSTALVLSMSLAVLLYSTVYFFAPAASVYYNIKELTIVLRTIALVIFFNGINTILIAKNVSLMNFRFLFYVNITSSLLSGVVGIVLALLKYGIWALVFQKLLQQVALSFFLSIFYNWGNGFSFSKQRMKYLLSFSSKVLLGHFIAFVSDNIYSTVIGKIYSTEELGYYDKADTIPKSLVLNLVTALMSVSLPTFSSYQCNTLEMKRVTRKVVKMATYIIFPVIFGIYATANQLVVVLFSNKWIASVPIIQSLCMWYLTVPVLQILSQVLYAQGRLKIRSRLEIIKMVITVFMLAVFVILMKVKISTLVLIKGFVSCIILVLNSIYTKKYIDYGILEQLSDMMIPFLYSTVMALGVSCVPLLGYNIYITLSVQFIFGIALYIGTSIVFNDQNYYELVKILRKIINRKGESNE